MSTFRVNTTLDTVAVNLRRGKDATGHISLRSAIMAADARGGSNTIILRSGTFTLTIAGANEDASATGDLDLTGNLTIKGCRFEQDHHRRQQPGPGHPGPAGQDDHLGRHHPERSGQLRRRPAEQRRPGDPLVRCGHGEPGHRHRPARAARPGADRTAATPKTAATAATVRPGSEEASSTRPGRSASRIARSPANQAIGGDGGQGGAGGFSAGADQPAGNGQKRDRRPGEATAVPGPRDAAARSITRRERL